MTAKEILIKNKRYQNATSLLYEDNGQQGTLKNATHFVLDAMEEYGKQQWNEAIEECYFERISIGDGEYVPVERILKLKKP